MIWWSLGYPWWGYLILRIIFQWLSLRHGWCVAGAENGEFLVLTGNEKWQFGSLVQHSAHLPALLHFCTEVRRWCEGLLAQQTATFSHATQDKKRCAQIELNCVGLNIKCCQTRGLACIFQLSDHTTLSSGHNLWRVLVCPVVCWTLWDVSSILSDNDGACMW